MPKSLRELKSDFERTVVMKTFEQNGCDRRRTAKVLQITLRALEKIFDRHHLVKKRFSKMLPIPPASEDENS